MFSKLSFLGPCSSRLTKEAGHCPGRLGHVHFKDKVSVGGEAKQSALLSAELHQLLQDCGVLLEETQHVASPGENEQQYSSQWISCLTC